jgi:hypothetical protein
MRLSSADIHGPTGPTYVHIPHDPTELGRVYRYYVLLTSAHLKKIVTSLKSRKCQMLEQILELLKPRQKPGNKVPGNFPEIFKIGPGTGVPGHVESDGKTPAGVNV